MAREFVWTDRTMSSRKRKCGPDLFGAKEIVSKLPARERRGEVRLSARQLRAGRQSTSATARTFHESGVTAKSVRHSGGTGSCGRRNCDRAWAKSARAGG